MSESLIVEITNKKGLHARAAAKFVKAVARFPTVQAQVIKLADDAEGDSTPVQAASILGLMMLGADAGSKLAISAEGPQAEILLAVLKELIEARFGEPE